MPSWSDFWPSLPDSGRMKRALEGENTPLTINETTLSAKFAGSEGSVYLTNPSGCTCPDYSINRLPCKHVIRLAMCLGMLSGDGMVDDLPAALLKYESGHLIQLIKTAPILEAVDMVQQASIVFSSKKNKIPVSSSLFAPGFYLFIVQDGYLVADKRYKKDVQTLETVLVNRISSIIRPHLAVSGFRALLRQWDSSDEE